MRPLYNRETSVSLTHSGTSSGTASVNHLSSVSQVPDETTTFYHGDQIGSSRLMSSVNGYPVWQATYLPFGYEYNPQITVNHYKFTGKERDSESGLDNFNARYYASTTGRFMTPDWAARPTAVPYAVFGDPQSLNLYGYVRNDPISRADADGHCGPASGMAGQTGLFPICAQNDGGPEPEDTANSAPKMRDENLGHLAQNQSLQDQQPQEQAPQQQPLKYDQNQPHPPEPAQKPILPVLQCMQKCSTFTISSTSEATPVHKPGSPHREKQAADLEVPAAQAQRTLSCAAKCGAQSGRNEFINPSRHATGGHVHVQTVPDPHCRRCDLPDAP